MLQLESLRTYTYVNSALSTVLFPLQQNPVVEIAIEPLKFDVIGLVFVMFFAVVLVVQITGMLFHRWGTISHIIATTKLYWCQKKSKVSEWKGKLITSGYISGCLGSGAFF